MSTSGDNSENLPGNLVGEQLKAFLERVERLEEEKSGLTEDIREVYAEAKASGFDTKIMRQVVKRRRMDAADRREQDELLEIYEASLGDLMG